MCPYLALETCRHWRLSTKTVNLMRTGKMPTVTIEQAQNNFCKAVRSGLLKILSKMGISLLSSYCGAQIFEVDGLGQEIIDIAFTGSVSKIGGLTLDEENIMETIQRCQNCSTKPWVKRVNQHIRVYQQHLANRLVNVRYFNTNSLSFQISN